MQGPVSQAANRYVYVLVRKDIPEPHRQVQIAHAAIAATIAFNSDSVKPHPHLVVCGVEDERELNDSFNRLKEQGVPCCEWREDDMGNQATAVATAPLQGNRARKPMKGFRLLT